jgi:hypothetical protein
MQARQESVLPGLLFLGAWWGFAEYTSFGGYSFFAALALWPVGWMSVSLAGRAIHRLGGMGWSLLLQLLTLGAVFVACVPASNIIPSLLAIGIIGLPLVLAGAAWRGIYDRLPKHAALLGRITDVSFYGSIGLGPAVYALQGPAKLDAIPFFLMIAMASVPLFYGWMLGQQPRGGERDARFGTEEAYRTAGMSDER